MQQAFTLLDISSYISVEQAAKALGISKRALYRYVKAGRLPTIRVDHTTMLPIEAVEQFQPGFVGRPRKKTPAWRGSPKNLALLITYIRVQLRPGQQAKFVEKLETIKREERHLFPGTVTRYISQDTGSPATMTIQLVWKNGEMAYEAAREQAIEAFEAELADVLDWSTAQYSMERTILYT